MDIKLGLSVLQTVKQTVDVGSDLQKRISESMLRGPILSTNGYKTSEYIIVLCQDDIELLLDKLSDALSEDGMSEDGEPNEHGRYLDDIIGLFSSYYYD